MELFSHRMYVLYVRIMLGVFGVFGFHGFCLCKIFCLSLKRIFLGSVYFVSPSQEGCLEFMVLLLEIRESVLVLRNLCASPRTTCMLFLIPLGWKEELWTSSVCLLALCMF